MKAKLFVAIEGLDGVGKTSFSKLLCKKLGYIYIKSPEGVFSDVRNHFDKITVSHEDKLSFYSGVAIRNSIKTQEYLNNTGVVMDRYIYSALAYNHETYSLLSDNLKKLFDLLIVPDIVFYLYSDFKTIRNRLNSESRVNLPNDFLYSSEKQFADIDAAYKAILPKNSVFLDNSGPIDKTIEVAISVVDSICNKRD